MTTNAAICKHFFEAVSVAEPVAAPSSPSASPTDASSKQTPPKCVNRHRCRLCNQIYAQATNTGYTNLMTHLRLKHQDWPDIFQSRSLSYHQSETVPIPVPLPAPTRPAVATAGLISIPPEPVKGTPGRKRGPVYAHFEDAPEPKKMRCIYCQVDTVQISGRLKQHIQHCPSAPQDVRKEYGSALAPITAAAAVATATESFVIRPAAHPQPVARVHPAQLPPRVQTPTIRPNELEAFENKLTTAMIATNTPWRLLDHVGFQEAMKLFLTSGGFGSGEFPLTATCVQEKVLGRLSGECDVECQAALASSRYGTLVVKNADVGDGSSVYLIVDERRRPFVLAEREDPSHGSSVPSMSELLSVVAKLPKSSNNMRIFVCAPTTGVYVRARQQLLSSDLTTVSISRPFTLMGVCMVQQTVIMFRELAYNCEALEEAFSNAAVIADALKATSSLRQSVLRQIRLGGDNEYLSIVDLAQEDASVFVRASIASWRSLAMAVTQATRLEPYLRPAIADERQAVSISSPLLEMLIDIDNRSARWSALGNTDEILRPLYFVSALSELPTTTSGQLLALWIWLFGAATCSPLIDDENDTLLASLLKRMQCYVETHFIACLVLDPRVQGAGLSVSGLRRARGVTMRLAQMLLPNLDDTSFIRSYNDYMKKQDDFGDSGVWNAANTANPMDFWGDYEGDPAHTQLAVVAKTVCAYVPFTCSTEAFWTAHVRQCSRVNEDLVPESIDHREKLTKIRHGATTKTRPSVKSTLDQFRILLSSVSELSVDDMLHHTADTRAAYKATPFDVSVREVFESVQDGLLPDLDATNSPSKTLDESWLDISSAGLEKIRRSMKDYLTAASQLRVPSNRN